MGKITVKYYLEKKVRPITIYGDVLAYPLYIRITINRNTTQIRSITESLMSEKAFDIYKDTGKFDYYEIYVDFPSFNIDLTIENELDLIKLSIETLAVRNEDLNFSDRNIRQLLMSLLTSARKAFIKTGWNIDPYIDDFKIYQFIFSFNQDLSMIHCIKNIEDVFNVDMKGVIPDYILKNWQVIEIIKSVAQKQSFVEFIKTDYTQALIETIKATKASEYFFISEQYPISESEIIEISNKLIKRYFTHFING